MSRSPASPPPPQSPAPPAAVPPGRTYAPQTSAVPEHGVAQSPLLAGENLSKTYQMGRVRLQVLRRCSLTLRAGEFLAIMGKSGSGKSTLLHVLGALDVPEIGQVLLDGKPLFPSEARRSSRISVLDVLSPAERWRNAVRRKEFGFVFQFYHLLPELNVLENVLLPLMVDAPVFGWRRGPARDAAMAIIDRVGLSARIKHRPAELSGGERQRVAIARALVHRPRILFADEPTGNLDAETGGSIMTLLRGLHREGQTMVMVTHDPGIAQHADRLLQLENGVLKTEAAPRQNAGR